MFYNSKTNGFYLKKDIDNIEISDELYDSLFDLQSHGFVICADAQGLPIAVEPVHDIVNIQ